MLNLILSFLFFFLAGFCGALLGCYLFSKRKWRLYLDEKTKTLQLIQEDLTPGKVEFLSEPTAKELEEMAKPEWSKFLAQFKLKK